MRRLDLTPRADWQAKADAVGFVYHHTDGQAYWDESAVYAFTLAQIEDDLEPAAADLHELCLDLVDEVAGSEALDDPAGDPGRAPGLRRRVVARQGAVALWPVRLRL
jgi:glutathionylspermidine synthase